VGRARPHFRELVGDNHPPAVEPKERQLMARTLSSTVLRILLLDESAPGKEEGVIELWDERSQLTQTKVRFNALDDLPNKIRELLRSRGEKTLDQAQNAESTQMPGTLEQLLARVTEGNLHHEQDMGPPVGQEVW
jgi:hypothetical protein